MENSVKMVKFHAMIHGKEHSFIYE